MNAQGRERCSCLVATTLLARCCVCTVRTWCWGLLRQCVAPFSSLQSYSYMKKMRNEITTGWRESGMILYIV